MSAPLIVTAELAPHDLAWLDALRRKHFPPDRNYLLAHLTIFHALPPTAEAEVRARLASLARDRAPTATITGIMDLGGGVAFRIASDGLDRLRAELQEMLRGLLSAQDAGGWRPHVTIQNKVPPKVARELFNSIERSFTSRPIGIRGLGLHRYLGGPWETLAVYPFRGT